MTTYLEALDSFFLVSSLVTDPTGSPTYDHFDRISHYMADSNYLLKKVKRRLLLDREKNAKLIEEINGLIRDW